MSDQGFSVTYKQWQDLNAALTESRREVEALKANAEKFYSEAKPLLRKAEAENATLRQEVEGFARTRADLYNQILDRSREAEALRQENGRLLAVIARTCPSGHAMPPVYSFCPICAELERLRRQVEEQAGKLAEVERTPYGMMVSLKEQAESSLAAIKATMGSDKTMVDLFIASEEKLIAAQERIKAVESEAEVIRRIAKDAVAERDVAAERERGLREAGSRLAAKLALGVEPKLYPGVLPEYDAFLAILASTPPESEARP